MIICMNTFTIWLTRLSRLILTWLSCMLGLHVGNNFCQLRCINVSSFWSGGLQCRTTKDISNFMSGFMFHAFTVRLCKVGFATAKV